MNDGFSVDMILRSPDILATAITLLTGILGLAAAPGQLLQEAGGGGYSRSSGAKIAKTEEHAQARPTGLTTLTR